MSDTMVCVNRSKPDLDEMEHPVVKEIDPDVSDVLSISDRSVGEVSTGMDSRGAQPSRSDGRHRRLYLPGTLCTLSARDHILRSPGSYCGRSGDRRDVFRETQHGEELLRSTVSRQTRAKAPH